MHFARHANWISVQTKAERKGSFANCSRPSYKNDKKLTLDIKTF